MSIVEVTYSTQVNTNLGKVLLQLARNLQMSGKEMKSDMFMILYMMVELNVIIW